MYNKFSAHKDPMFRRMIDDLFTHSIQHDKSYHGMKDGIKLIEKYSTKKEFASCPDDAKYAAAYLLVYEKIKTTKEEKKAISPAIKYLKDRNAAEYYLYQKNNEEHTNTILNECA